jgi:HK97 family phage portal protein
MSRIGQKLAGWVAKRFNLKNPPQWFIKYFGGGPSSAGVQVGHQTALQFTPFWAAVRIISGTLAALPFKVYSRLDEGGKEPQPKHKVYSLLHESPNEYMDAVTFIETRMAHVLCYGNGYAEIQRDGAGRPVALWPLLPNRTQRKVRTDGTLYYEVRINDTGTTVEIPDANVLHIKGLGFDGYTGYDVVSYHKDAIGYGIGAKEYGARFFQNDASPGGVLECPGVMSNEAYQRLKTSWDEVHSGLSNAHRKAILEEGTKWNAMGVEPQKAQMIETMKFTVDDCARIFGIPPHKLGSMEFSKYSNVYELNNDFYCSTMLYWFRKWEQEINRKLFMPSEQGRLFVEILVDALLRGDLAARTAYYVAGRNNGWLCVDEIREKENLNPLPDGKGQIYLEPLNMKPVGSEPPAEPKDPVDPIDPVDEGDDPVRAAHLGLLITQCQRIVTKQIKATRDKLQDENWWKRHRAWASEIIEPSAAAYERTRKGVKATAQATVERIVREWFCEAIPFDRFATEKDAAEVIALDIIDRIGGTYAG